MCSLLRCSLLALFVGSISSMRGDDWPHFLGPNLDLHCSEEGLDLDFPLEGPPKLWEFPKGKGHAGPVVVDDHVVLFHQEDDKEVIHCLAAEDGSVIWEHRYPVDVGQSCGISDTPRSSPAVDVETRTVYTLGNDSDLIAFDLSTGDIRWQFKLAERFGEAPTFFGQGSSPLPYRDKLIVQAGSDRACVVALDKRTGETLWEADHEWNGSYASPVIARINGGDRLLVFAGGKTRPPHGGLLCIDPESGEIHDAFPWRSDTFTSVNAASPVPCGNNRVFITEDYGRGGVMLVYDANFRARPLWSSKDFGCQFQTPIYHDEILYGFGGNGGLMVAFSATTGALFWSEGFFQTTIAWEGRDIPISLGKAHMIHADGGFLCLSENGSLIRFLLGRVGPTITSRARLFYAPETWAPPVISNGRLFVNQNEFESRLLCYDIGVSGQGD